MVMIDMLGKGRGTFDTSPGQYYVEERHGQLIHHIFSDNNGIEVTWEPRLTRWMAWRAAAYARRSNHVLERFSAVGNFAMSRS